MAQPPRPALVLLPPLRLTQARVLLVKWPVPQPNKCLVTSPLAAA